MFYLHTCFIDLHTWGHAKFSWVRRGCCKWIPVQRMGEGKGALEMWVTGMQSAGGRREGGIRDVGHGNEVYVCDKRCPHHR